MSGLMRAMDALGELTYIEPPKLPKHRFQRFSKCITLRSTSQKAAIITATSDLRIPAIRLLIVSLPAPFWKTGKFPKESDPMPSGKKHKFSAPHMHSGNQDSSHRHIGGLLKSQHLASSMSGSTPCC